MKEEKQSDTDQSIQRSVFEFILALLITIEARINSHNQTNEL